jgi:ABC-type glycerol-3-phosphate transport system substrate-binding protein
MSPPRLSRRRVLAASGAGGLSGFLGGCLGQSTVDAVPAVETAVPDEPVTVTIPYPIADLGPEDLQSSLRAAGLPEPISVDVVDFGQQSASYLAAYRRLLYEQATEPALLVTDSGWLSVLASQQSLVNLSRALPETIIDEVDRAYLDMASQTARVDGDYYGIPMYVDLGTILYRREAFAQAGVDPEARGWTTEPPTWQQFSQAVDQATAASDTRFGLTLALDDYPGLACCTFNEIMSGFGGAYFGGLETLFGPVGDRPVTVTEQPVIDALEMLQAIVTGTSGPADASYATDIVPSAAINWSGSRAQQQFFDGNAVAHRGWPFEIAVAGSEEYLGEDLGVMPIPAGVPESQARYEGTGGTMSALGGWHLSLNPFASASQLQGAYHVIKTMMTESFARHMLETDGLLPPNPDLFAADRPGDAAILDRYTEALSVASENAIARPVTPVWTHQSRVIANHVNAVFSRYREPRSAMADLDARLRSIEHSMR